MSFEKEPSIGEMTPAIITAKMEPENLQQYFSKEAKWGTLLRLYFTGAGKYTSLTRSTDYDIAAIVGETVSGEKPGPRMAPSTAWDRQTLDHIFESENLDQLPEEQKEVKLLWGLRVASVKLGLSFLKTLELPEDAERRFIRPLEHHAGEEGPQTVSPWAIKRAHTAEEELVDVLRPDEGDNLPQTESPETKQLLQIQIVRFCKAFNTLVDYYNQPPTKLTRHLASGGAYRSNASLPGEYWRVGLLLDITRRFNLWDQHKQIEKDLGSPEDH